MLLCGLQHAVFKRTDSYLAYKRHAERDADMEKMLKESAPPPLGPVPHVGSRRFPLRFTPVPT
jgi:hypothetical protein